MSKGFYVLEKINEIPKDELTPVVGMIVFRSLILFIPTYFKNIKHFLCELSAMYTGKNSSKCKCSEPN